MKTKLSMSNKLDNKCRTSKGYTENSTASMHAHTENSKASKHAHAHAIH